MKITYDSNKISYEDLLDNFLKLHNYQYSNKTQYMSAIFAQNDEQQRLAEAKLQAIKGPVATQIKPQTPWHDAEEYHQKYLEKQRRQRFF